MGISGNRVERVTTNVYPSPAVSDSFSDRGEISQAKDSSHQPRFPTKNNKMNTDINERFCLPPDVTYQKLDEGDKRLR